MKRIDTEVDGQTVRYEISDAAWAFYDACSKDETLAVELRPLRSAGEIAQLAQSRGFAASSEEIWQGLLAVEALQAARGRADELTDEEVDLVAGGRGRVVTCTGADFTRCCGPHRLSTCSCVCPPN